MKFKSKCIKDGDKWVKRKFLFLPMSSIEGEHIITYWLQFVNIQYTLHAKDVGCPSSISKLIINQFMTVEQYDKKQADRKAHNRLLRVRNEIGDKMNSMTNIQADSMYKKVKVMISDVDNLEELEDIVLGELTRYQLMSYRAPLTASLDFSVIMNLFKSKEEIEWANKKTESNFFYQFDMFEHLEELYSLKGHMLITKKYLDKIKNLQSKS